MTARQFLALQSARSTAAKLRKHRASYDGNEGFKEQVDVLHGHLSRVDLLAREQAAAAQGTGDLQVVARDQLVNSLLIVSGLGEGWAAATGQTLLRHRLTAHRTELLGWGLRLDVRADNLLQAAREAASLGAVRFGLTTELLDELAGHIVAWTKSSTTREFRDERKTVTQDLGDAVVETMTFLRDVIDPLMRGFLRSDPRFFEEYRNSRRIGGRRTSREEAAAPEAADRTLTPSGPGAMPSQGQGADAGARMVSEGWVVDEDDAADAALEAVLTPTDMESERDSEADRPQLAS